jgi:hypothetical protein
MTEGIAYTLLTEFCQFWSIFFQLLILMYFFPNKKIDSLTAEKMNLGADALLY